MNKVYICRIHEVCNLTEEFTLEMRIAILHPSYENSTAPFAELDPPADPKPYLKTHKVTEFFISKQNAVMETIQIINQGFDVFINLVDGAWDEDRPGIEVVQTLEKFNQAFTGANSQFYDPSRELMKLVCHYWGIKTPNYAFSNNIEDASQIADNLNFPLIVKHPNSYSSVGLTPKSKVQNVNELRVQLEIMISTYGYALVEEFIEGKEFTALVVENPVNRENPIVYTPLECHFGKNDTFKHFELKWIEYDSFNYSPVIDNKVSNEIKDICSRFFVALDGTGYGRCDIRMNEQGELFMLEINPNCGIFYPQGEFGTADHILEIDPLGFNHFTQTILNAAQLRKFGNKKKWHVSYRRGKDYGMYATEFIATGDLIEPFEEQAHILVSKTNVLNHWNEQKQDWFRRYAYPITDEIWVMWPDDPLKWKPINHSCNPNAWLDGMDLVARREINPFEEITIDYATFMNEQMPEFQCNCNSDNCRSIIRGTDYLETFVENYENHVSDYVSNIRKSRLIINNPLATKPKKRKTSRDKKSRRKL